MKKQWIVWLMTVLPLAAQTSTDQDLIQRLIAEVRQLRSELQAMSATSQRLQIALYTLQMQESAVTRATQRKDEIRNRCHSTQQATQFMGPEIQNLENSLAAGTTYAGQTKAMMQERLNQLKSAYEFQSKAMQDCQADEAEAQSHLRNEQAKLAEVQSRIERLDKDLEKMSAGK